MFGGIETFFSKYFKITKLKALKKLKSLQRSLEMAASLPYTFSGLLSSLYVSLASVPLACFHIWKSQLKENLKYFIFSFSAHPQRKLQQQRGFDACLQPRKSGVGRKKGLTNGRLVALFLAS